MLQGKLKHTKPAKLFLTVVVAILLYSTSLAQQFEHKHRSLNLILESKAYYGFLMPHHLEMEKLNAHFLGYEISVSKATYGRTRWEYMYNYPLIGVALWYSELGNNQYIGSGIAIFPFINFPIIKDQHQTISLRIGMGVGYIEKPFHRLENYKNIAIGSHINAAANFMIEYRREINDRFIFSGGLALIHFSNGSIKTPNFGINIPSINAGIAYRLTKENPYLRKKLLPELYPFEFDGKRYMDIDFGFGMGIKDMQGEFGKQFHAWSFFGNVYKQISFKSKLGVGFDFSYDGSDLFKLERNGSIVESKMEIIRPGLNFSYELVMSRVSFTFGLGGYLGGREKSDGNIYEKIGLKYLLSREVFAHVTLKAHAARADFIAFGIGYQLRLKYY